MVLNSFVWLAGANPTNSTTVRVATLRDYYTGLSNIKTAIAASLTLELSYLNLTTLTASTADIIFIDTYTKYTPAQIQAVLNFANQPGKGIVVAGHAWWWASQNPDANVFTDLAVNRILWPLGLLVTTSWQVGFQTTPAVLPQSWYYYNSYVCLAAVLGTTQGVPIDPAAVPMVKRMLNELLNILPPRAISVETNTGAVYDLLDKIMDSGSAPPAVGPNNPFNTTSASLGRYFKVYLEAANIRRGDITDLAPSPSAPLFPGLPAANADRVEVTVNINATFIKPPHHFLYAGWGTYVWRSTGLYAPPGSVVTATIATSSALNKTLQAQIGCHTDDLTGKAVWYRLPYTVSRFPLKKKVTKIGNPLGGLIFVLVPDGMKLGNVQITFSNVIRAPYFKLGDDPARWEAKVRQYPAPWAELDSGKFVIMLPSRAIRKYGDPTPVLKHWNKILDADAWLANMNPDRARPERFLVDADIGGGWMHSGYPMMAYNTTGVWNEMLNVTYLKTKGAWGPLHELGHNHQWSEMVFTGGVTEASCNLFTIYALESTGVPASSWENWPNVSPQARNNTIRTYLANGAKFNSDWSVWTALVTFLQLKDGFGWGFYRRIYAAYQNYTTLAEDKIQTWIQTTCNISGVNLVPFYSKWGFPITANSTSRCGALPAWVADPMTRY